MAENIKQKFLDFCKKFGKLKTYGDSLQCYIEPETIERNVGAFTSDLLGLVKSYSDDWYVAVKPEFKDILFEFYSFSRDKTVVMEVDIHRNADTVLIEMNSDGLMIQGRKGEERGCTLMIDKITDNVSVSCLGTLDPQDPRISSVSSRAEL